MPRFIVLMVVATFFFFTNAHAGGFSFGSDYGYRSKSFNVVAPIQIKDKGLYNLVVTVGILNEPYEEKIYKSSSYEKFLDRLALESNGVAIDQILMLKEPNIQDLAKLKANIEKEIRALIDTLKKQYSLTHSVQTVFSISRFILVEPDDNP